MNASNPNYSRCGRGLVRPQPGHAHPIPGWRRPLYDQPDRHHHRRLRVRWRQPDQRHHWRKCHQHRKLVVLWRQPDQCHDPANSVTSIGDFGFSSDDSLTNIAIGLNVSSIGNYAFEYCVSLTSVTIPASVTFIGTQAFDYCSSLTSITVSVSNPDYSSVAGVFVRPQQDHSHPAPGRRRILRHRHKRHHHRRLCAFNGDGLDTVTIGTNVTSIGNYAFEYCDNLTKVTIPKNVASIGRHRPLISCLQPDEHNGEHKQSRL